MVASAVPREGKTTLASHLAVSLAQAGRRTLLIDGDWRRPQLHYVFDLPRGPGLCEVLRGTTTMELAAQPGPVPNLTILVAGVDSHLTDSAHAMNDMRTILDTVRRNYDFIVLIRLLSWRLQTPCFWANAPTACCSRYGRASASCRWCPPPSSALPRCVSRCWGPSSTASPCAAPAIIITVTAMA